MTCYLKTIIFKHNEADKSQAHASIKIAFEVILLQRLMVDTLKWHKECLLQTIKISALEIVYNINDIKQENKPYQTQKIYQSAC